MILVATIIIAIKLSAKIFRMGMLMYARRVNQKDVLRSMRG